MDLWNVGILPKHYTIQKISTGSSYAASCTRYGTTWQLDGTQVLPKERHTSHVIRHFYYSPNPSFTRVLRILCTKFIKWTHHGEVTSVSPSVCMFQFRNLPDLHAMWVLGSYNTGGHKHLLSHRISIIQHFRWRPSRRSLHFSKAVHRTKSYDGCVENTRQWRTSSFLLFTKYHSDDINGGEMGQAC
jgi:hypothetical protein